jgi:hypothetical protein
MHTSLKIIKIFIVFLFCSTCFGHSCAHHQEPPNFAQTASSHLVSLGWLCLPALVCHYCRFRATPPPPLLIGADHPSNLSSSGINTGKTSHSSLTLHHLLKIEPSQCSETSAFNTQTPGKYPEDNSSIKLQFARQMFGKVKYKIL